ncbi:VOC family protein [Methylobacterium sp. Leaf118]|uniref:VOC family protein n=1 Tax=Methylobacterium sp. Leaf118 TaxID=2876562 RepID=UPI001E4D7CB9|nr:VOC family protein [Methylobacterium sp. Leaf118]
MQTDLTLGARDAAAAHAFDAAVLATVGWGPHAEFPGWRGDSLGARGEGLVLWVCTPFDGGEASVGNGTMMGFPAPSRAAADAVHAAAMARGGTDEGGPGPRPQDGPDWYAASLRDPSGTKLAAVFDG